MTLQIKRRSSGATGAPSGLKAGEPAYSAVDDIFYLGKGDDGSGNALTIQAAGGFGAFVGLGATQTITGAKTFTTSPVLPTPSTADNSTAGATTAYVKSNLLNYLALAGGTMTGAITLAADPVSSNQPATKNYVDSLIQGLSPKGAVIAASTGNVTLSSPGTTLDGVTLTNPMRILLKDQTTLAENGIYVWTGSGVALVRATDMDAWTEVPSAYVLVEQGSTWADTGWNCTSDPGGTLGTTAITWIKFGSLGGLAPLASPGFTGTPSAPTPSAGTNTTQLATTAFVAASFLTISSAAATYAPINSPTFTGTPSAPTASAGTNTTQLATTAFVVVSYAPLASPALTGTPSAPTATAGTNSTQIATTGFVAASFLTISSAAATYAPLASPTFTGTPAAPTAAVDTNTTQLATTAFVLAQAASATPVMDGTGTTGSSTRYARGDHVHPTDTSRAALASPTFTGTPAAPTATAGTNTTQLATTAYVTTAVSNAISGGGSIDGGTF